MLIRAAVALASPARERFGRLLEAADAQVTLADPETIVSKGAEGWPLDLVVLDGSSPPQRTLSALAKLAEHPDRPASIAVVRREDGELRAALLASGCHAVLNDRLSDELLQETLSTLLSRLEHERQLERISQARHDRGDEALAMDRGMLEVLELAARVAPADSSVLLLGETGSGKEWMAQRIHAQSRRQQFGFVAINCAALPEHLLESELFGHVRGAFTGAVSSRRGLFELAHRGTLFLDEIGEMSAGLQAKLLRVLQDRVIRRVGGEASSTVDVRLMAATSRDLEGLLTAGEFRRDLYYRLAVVTLRIPPLRERPLEAGRLAEQAVGDFGKKIGRPGLRFTDEARAALRAYEWPGNVRELLNVMERAAVLCDGERIRVRDLPAELRGFSAEAVLGAADRAPTASGETGASELFELPLREARRLAMERFERGYLESQLWQVRGRVGEAVERSGIDPRSLYDKMKRYGLRKEDFRNRA